MLVENATLPWGQSWERVFHKHKCIQFIALVPCTHGEIRHLTAIVFRYKVLIALFKGALEKE
jgi:hypothetical protein